MKNKGITIVEMVIVVLILILLAIIALWSSKRTSVEAEAALIFSELKAVHTGIIKIKQEYELENFEDYTAGEHYNTELTDASDNVIDDWYVIYGIDDSRYNKKIMQNLGVDELKRNYAVNFNTSEVRFLDGPVKIYEYEVNSYDEMKRLMESGVI